MKTRIDLHTHTRHSDGQGTPAQIAIAARKAGLHALALTDHHSNVGPKVDAVVEALRNVGVLPLVGVEYSTNQGHLLIYGVDVEMGAWGMYPEMQAVIDDVNALGGCCIAPHPYKGYTKSLQQRVETIRGLCAVEAINGQVEQRDPATNRKARESALRMGIPMTGASDAHFPEDIGIAYTEFDAEIKDEAGFLAALRSGQFRPRMNHVLFQARQAARRAKFAALPLGSTPVIPEAPRGLYAQPVLPDFAHWMGWED